jgi:hypothetical protein
MTDISKKSQHAAPREENRWSSFLGALVFSTQPPGDHAASGDTGKVTGDASRPVEKSAIHRINEEVERTDTEAIKPFGSPVQDPSLTTTQQQSQRQEMVQQAQPASRSPEDLPPKTDLRAQNESEDNKSEVLAQLAQVGVATAFSIQLDYCCSYVLFLLS